MKTTITFLLVLFLSIEAFSQQKVADEFYKNYSYIKAAEFYRKAIDKGDNGVEIFTRLADCFYNNSNSKQAAYWYSLAAQRKEGLDNRSIFKYAQSLRSVGEYEKAEVWLKKLPDSISRIANVDYNKLKILNKDSVQVTNLHINTKHSDFGSFVHGNKLYFSSAKNEKGEIYEWNNQPYLDVYQARITKKENEHVIEDIAPIISTKINTAFHESSITITNDGKTLYFTRNNLNVKNKLEYDKEGTSQLKIYKASLIDGVWSNIKELSINDKVHSNGHPALSPDEKTLYFVSNRPGGYGETDIYKVAILGDGSLGKPENLGAKINTVGKEMFPFVAKDYTLYFSSDGYKNLGLLDIYKTELFKNNISEVINIGAPFNSGYDDFAFFYNKDGKTGYFSSNRSQGKGKDDIYAFKTLTCFQNIKGKTYDDRTKEILPNTLVELINKDGEVVQRFVTQEDATYSFEVDCEKEFTIRATKLDYKDDFKNVKSTEVRGKEVLQDLYLTPLIVDNEIVINPIFFDFNKSDIRPDAAYELEFVVKVLNNHPKMVIKIEAHTDSRGSDRYNEVLSDKRAKAARDHIISRAITSNRIQSAIGYGEKKIVNKCKNGVTCTEEEHQENRRSKFIILNNFK
ncbi:OmpA family protein [Tenacibaculum bernardetii]|uniref:OmpA family protein n=1 Tax=Tenacibaculum bernardetii TaxID=3021375 RepID=UPI0023AF75E6|nr:OmpA family protein [Tenacibaculum bernardetii]